ncbi:MAG: tRNA pseudouridine(55) synthase TruB [Alphaproteobacteria bacterium]|jgi:tRNA pseudouridine55 synthase|nr:tRNA pseudouridine(55) synthase TruB [Alphaproteobacteria bacterium]
MARKRKGDKIDGWINLDKPLGLTSTQAMAKVRWLMKAQKAGHAGTLDPLATGILPIALGEATKTISYIQDGFKTYSFTVQWGEQRDTDDGEGKIIATSDVRPSKEQIESILKNYTGTIMQTPPKFSAIKIDGARAYDLARDGEEVELKEREVYIESLSLLTATPDTADFRMVCGKGTYVRSLARDMGRELGCLGYITALKREKVGPFTLESSISLDKLAGLDDIARLNEAVLLPLETALDDIPALAVREDEAARLRNGQVLAFISRPDFERLGRAGLDGTLQEALVMCNNKPVALVEAEGPEVRPVRILNI